MAQQAPVKMTCIGTGWWGLKTGHKRKMFSWFDPICSDTDGKFPV